MMCRFIVSVSYPCWHLTGLYIGGKIRLHPSPPESSILALALGRPARAWGIRACDACVRGIACVRVRANFGNKFTKMERSPGSLE